MRRFTVRLHEFQRFRAILLRFLRGRNFDGLEIDWRYPGFSGGMPEDNKNYVELLKVRQTEESFSQAW